MLPRVSLLTLVVFLVLRTASSLYVDEEEGLFLHDLTEGEFEDDGEENPFIVQGDIIVDPDRNALRSDANRWPDGVIPYFISTKFPDNEHKKIELAMQEIMASVNPKSGKKCISFVKRDKEVNYVSIKPSKDKCAARVGKYEKLTSQALFLKKTCMDKALIMHELIHSIGFWHEMSRPDRDTYVNVYTNKILKGSEYNYEKYPDIRTLGAKYDYQSIMHYNTYDLTKDGRYPVMTPTAGHTVKGRMGQRVWLSYLDVWKIQKLYNCPLDTTHIQRTPLLEECYFENGLCNFENEKTGTVQWTTMSGKSQFGPRTDTSSGVGKYAIALSKFNKGKKAKLVSKKFFTDRQFCLEVYVHNYNGAGQIMFYYRAKDSIYIKRIIGHGVLNKNMWYFVRFTATIPDEVKEYQIMMIAYINDSDIALDDLYIFKGACQ